MIKLNYLRTGFFLCLALLLGAMITSQPPVAAAQTAMLDTLPGTPTPAPGRSVVIVHYADRAALQRAAAFLDIWEVDATLQTFVAMVSEAEMDWLASQGYPVQVDPVRTALLMAPPGYPCYRTIDTLYSDLQQRLLAYPGLTELVDIGNTYENRDLWVMRVTNKAMGGTKPRFFLMANIHGREMITPETAMVFLDYLLQNYGTNPDVTWLLDWNEVHILPSSNPDGHVRNETTVAYWRKNTRPYGSCSPDSIGVDLNRNHSFKWGWDDSGSSPDPCDETYRGPTAVSESETQAVQNYISSLFADQRGPGDSDPAPANATGIMITLHSYENLVLWPWGWTSTLPPNSAALAALGRKLATYNGYTPEQSDTLYATNGTTDDWSYGELGVASYTFEMGAIADGFFPSCSRYDALIQPNLPALLYAAKVARTPYMTSLGPDALNVTATPNPPLSGQLVTLEATINDVNNGNQVISAAEYYLDLPPWAGGSPIAMQAKDGAFNSPNEVVKASLNPASISSGKHMIFVRGRDAGGNWGPPGAVFLQINNRGAIEGHVVDAVYSTPIHDASIILSGQAGSYQTATDIAGDYRILLESGVYTATASAFGYFTQTLTDILISSGVTLTQNFTLTAVPTGTLSGAVVELGSNLPLEAVIQVEGTPFTTTSQAQTGAFSLVLPAGVYDLSAEAPSHTGRSRTGIHVVSGQANPTVTFALPKIPCLLLVDDDYYRMDRPYSYETYYLPPLQRSGFAYTSWNVQTQASPSFTDLSSYPVVLWLTGDAPYNTLDLSEQSQLNNYLASGGRLFLSGQNIAQDIAADPGYFLRDVLHAAFLSGPVNPLSITGSGLYAGQSYALQGGDGANNQTSPDVIQPLSGASPVFTYTLSSHTAALAFDGGASRLLFYAFGIEGVSTIHGRQAILHAGLDWLGCAPSPVDLRLSLDGPSGPLGPDDPLTYTLTLTNASAVPLTELMVTDTLPAEVEFLSASPAAFFSNGQVHWSGLSIPAEGSLELAINARVRKDLPGGTRLIYNQDYAAQAAQTPAPVIGTTSVETQLILPLTADLSVAIDAQPEVVHVRDLLTYTLEVANAGPDDATSVTLTTTLPVSVTFISVSSGCTPINMDVICALSDLASGESQAITVTVTVPASAALITSTTQVTADQYDGYQANNTDDLTVQVAWFKLLLPYIRT